MKFLATLMVAAGALVIPNAGLAQDDYPNKPITLIYPWPVGGVSDVLTRAMQPFLEKELGVRVLPVAKPGGNMEVGTVAMANAEPDGYTIGQVSDPPFVLLTLKDGKLVSPDDFVYLATTSWDEVAISVPVDSPYDTFDKFIDAARAGKIKFGISGIGSSDEYWGYAFFMKAIGAEENSVGFKGYSPAETAMAGGHIDAVSGNVGSMSARPDLHKVIVTFGDERSIYFPNVPTAKEMGYDVVMAATRIFVAPAGVPADRIAKLRDAFAAVAKNPEAQAALAAQKLPIEYLDAEKTREYVLKQEKTFGGIGGAGVVAQ